MKIVGICLHQSHHQIHSQLIVTAKPLCPAHWKILLRIHLGLTDRGQF
jgi:hypothetical protein